MSYFEHAHSPYPLVDEEGRVPYDLLVDFALTVGPSLFEAGVWLTTIKSTPAYTFVAFESDSGAVAHAFVETPIPGRIYRLESQLAEGWVMFGPGVRKSFELANGIKIDADPKCMIVEANDAVGFNLQVNGRSFPMPPTLTLVADGFTQSRVEPDRDLSTGVAPALNVSRNDAVIDETLLTRGLVAGGNPPITRVGDATPDINGNINVRVTVEPTIDGGTGEVIIVPTDNEDVVALIMKSQNVLGCTPSNLLDQLRFSDCGEGVQYQLPFDTLLQQFQGDDTPCGPVAPECDSSLTTEEDGGSL